MLESRYLRNGETVEQRFRAVADHVVQAEVPAEREILGNMFYEMMARLDFLPNTPCLANAGPDRSGQLDACFVLPMDDALTTHDDRGILDTARNTGLIHQTGGGTGFDFSRLRPKGSSVASSNGVASGPVSFITMINGITDAIKQGGIRRGANMAELNIQHPDILEFIEAKTTEHALTNFNISVSIPDVFMEKVYKKEIWPTMWTDGKTVAWGRIYDAEWLYKELWTSAWKYGDPGVVFIDRMNRDNPLKDQGFLIEATNPCGEVPLLPFEACTLGSINLSNFVTGDTVDWTRLGLTASRAVRFLDDVVEVNKTPIPEVDYWTRQTRRIGLGVMGWADMLNKLEIPYDSGSALLLASRVASCIKTAADSASATLATERGAYPMWQEQYGTPMRNIARLSVAPTGSISTIAGCSAGIEPYFSREVVRKVAIGELRESYPNSDKPWFRTAMEIAPEYHVRHQATWQKYVDNAVSKTINMRNDATPEAVKTVYDLAYMLGCKGITIYRDGSRGTQVYNEVRTETVIKCPACASSAIVYQEGCTSCQACSWSACTV